MNNNNTATTATIALRKRREEGSSTNDEVEVASACGGSAPAAFSGSAAAACGGSALISTESNTRQPPPAYPNPNLKITAAIELSRSAIESLRIEIQDHIVGQVYAMHRIYNDLKKKEAGLSKIQSGAPNETSTPDGIDGAAANDNDLTPPSCLRTMKTH